jgi:hypothetical protein
MTSRDRAATLFRDAARPGRGVRKRLVQSLSDPEPLVRHVAAIALAQRWPDQLPETVIRELLDTLARLEYLERLPIEDEYSAATATEEDCGYLANDIVVAFTQLACGQADFVIPRLLEFWSFDPQQYDFGHALLALTFPRTRKKVVGSRLTGVQQRVLEAAVRQDDIWQGDAFWPPALAAHGLPRTNEGMRRLMGYTW